MNLTDAFGDGCCAAIYAGLDLSEHYRSRV